MNYQRVSLSKKQKEELTLFVTRVNKKVKPLCMICFAVSTKTADARTPLPFPAFDESSIYGILVITSKKTNRQYVQKLANATSDHARIVAMTHNWEYIKEKLREKNKFFAFALQGGFIISGELIETTVPEHFPNELYPWAQVNFDYHIEFSIKFLEAASICKLKDHEGSCLYLLYQTVLQGCFTLIWVYSFYEPEFDDLDTLLNLCYCLEPRLEKYFQRDSSVISSHYDILTGIYRHVHFNKDLEIIERDAEIMLKFVGNFCDKLTCFCQERIDAYNELVILE